MTLLSPRNRKILAYLCAHEGPSYLCVANLSDSAQAAELGLSNQGGLVPLELTGRSAFPPVGGLPYMLTLPGYGFSWFELSGVQNIPSWHAQLPDILPELLTLTTRNGKVGTALAGREGRQFHYGDAAGGPASQ
jgi:maltose alpha-D-glucosyltransferase/alpha-amylase